MKSGHEGNTRCSQHGCVCEVSWQVTVGLLFNLQY